MEGLTTSAFLSLTVLYFMISYVRSELSSEECVKLGFNRANLFCSSCDLLGKYELDAIRENCKLCCTPDESGGAEKTAKRYPKARLEVCG